MPSTSTPQVSPHRTRAREPDHRNWRCRRVGSALVLVPSIGGSKPGRGAARSGTDQPRPPPDRREHVRDLGYFNLAVGPLQGQGAHNVIPGYVSRPIRLACGGAYPQLMRALTRWRWPLVGAAIVALGAIWLLGPKYTQLQLAPDAEGFRQIVGDERSRYISAGVADVAFTAFYGLLGLAIARTPLASRIGAWLVLAGAAFDEAENLLLIANVTAGMNLSDGRVELMRTAGVAKYVAIAAGVVLYVWAWMIERHRRRD